MRIGSPRILLVCAFTIAGLLTGIGVIAVYGPGSTTPAEQPPRAGSPALAPDSTVEDLHETGITGENVTVGVVDITGFDTDHPALAGNVVDARSFAPGGTVRNGGRSSHGTAAASVVTRTAPDSQLYLGSFDTVDGFEKAIEWMVREDVDIIVTPVTFYGKFDGRASTIGAVTRHATDHGVKFVAPVGNLGRGHWEGQYNPVGDGIHRFEGGTRNRLEASNGTVLRLWVSWNQTHASEDYTAELYRVEGQSARLVARSQPYLGDDMPNERIVARLENGTHYFQITGPSDPTGARLKVESPTHDLQFRSRSGSITAPATDPDVIAVGAYDRETRRVRPFSSAGPTRDGRVGVDIVAPDGDPAAMKPDGFVGTSASAPYVAGVTALLIDTGGDQSPNAIERVLELSADDIRKSGPDPVSGFGVVRPVEAVRIV